MAHATHPIPPPNWEAVLSQALYEGYLAPVQSLLEQKVRYWEALSSKDRFNLSPEDNQRMQRRMDAVAEEIQAVDNLLNAIPDLATLYWDHLERVQAELNQLRGSLHSARYCCRLQMEIIEKHINQSRP